MELSPSYDLVRVFMVKILKMTYSNAKINIEVSATTELNNHLFELYIFDFKKGDYNSEPNIKQPMSSMQASQDGGIYSFKFPIPGNCKVKCVISYNGDAIVTKERYIGDTHKVKVDVEPCEIGYLYKLKADVSISKKLIFYKSKVSSTKINIPADLIAGETLVFTIKDKDFRPRFETYSEFTECFSIS